MHDIRDILKEQQDPLGFDTRDYLSAVEQKTRSNGEKKAAMVIMMFGNPGPDLSHVLNEFHSAVTLCQFARTHVVKFTGFLAPIDTISS